MLPSNLRLTHIWRSGRHELFCIMLADNAADLIMPDALRCDMEIASEISSQLSH